MHEELVGLGERDDRPVHPKISHTSVPALHPSQLEGVHARSGPWTDELTRPVPAPERAHVEGPA
jgi:dTDP-glucose 4,6-dehydratase